MSKIILEVKNLRKKFGGFTAFGFILKRVLKSGKLVKVV